MLDNRFRGSALLCIFAASGFAGLIYQSIWSHYISLILGHSAYAQVLVLALFMGGMALGAWLISRRNTSLKLPLRTYAIIEFVLGVIGVGFHVYYQFVSSVSYTTLFPALGVGLPLELGRWFVAGFLILPQCVLLGMTFPLMSSGYLRWNQKEGGKVLSGLYFTNSIGAAMGALFATYALLPAVGLPGTTLAAGIVNIFVAILIWPLAKLEQPAYTRQEKPATAKKSLPLFILLVAAITGACSFIYEVAWIRMLSMVLGSTVHAFELMLAAFIAGMAFGGLWLRKRADRFKSPRFASGWAQVIKGCMALSTLFLYNYSFTWMEWLMQVLNHSADSSYLLFNVVSAGICMVIMFPTAFLAGMTLPLLTLTLLKDGADEAAIGKVYAANTLGAIVGVVLAVYIGLPFLGLRLTLWSGAAADIAVGIILLISFRQFAKAKLPHMSWKTAAGVSASIVVLVLALTLSHFDTKLMSSGVFRHGTLERTKNYEVLFHKDGRTATIGFLDYGTIRVITTNGKPDAGFSWGDGPAVASDEATMAFAAVLPMFYNHDAKSVAIIGFGSGMTTHFVLGNHDIEFVDTIEIEPAMVEGAHFFRPLVERAFTDTRSHIIIDDAKSYFATNKKKYDIIISEPSNPWVSGTASLFTEEFYRFIPQHLTEDGIFVQWIHIYEITPVLVNTVLKAMLPYFADIQVFQASDGSDLLMLASPTKKLKDLPDVTIPIHWNNDFLQEIALRGLTKANDLSLIYIGDKNLLQTYTALYPHVGRNSDFFPVLQMSAPKARFHGQDGGEFVQLKFARWPLMEVMTHWKPAVREEIPKQLLHDIPYARDVMSARAFRAVLMGEPLNELKDYISYQNKMVLERIRLAGLACQIDFLKTEVEIFVTLANVAAATIPYFSKEDSHDLWITPNWLKCQPQDTFFRDYLHFLASVAARDYRNTLQRGEKMLTTHEEFLLSREMRMVAADIIGAMQTSAYALGEYEKVLTLGEKFKEGEKPGFVHTFLFQAAKEKMRKE